MAKSFRELGRKAETLGEQGREAQQQVATCQARVSTLQSHVIAARRQLADASRTDEEGHPIGDVSAARAALWVAEGQLAAGQRALNRAQDESQRIRSLQEGHVRTMEQHNRIERTNLRKLRELGSHAFSADASALLQGIAERLNETEAARVALLESMGLDATPDFVSLESLFDGGINWNHAGFSRLDVSGDPKHLQRGAQGGQGGVDGTPGLSVPVGGDLQGMPQSILNGASAAGSNPEVGVEAKREAGDEPDVAEGVFAVHPVFYEGEIITGQNFNPQKDTASAFAYTDRICGYDSPRWQETANRFMDCISQEMSVIDERILVTQATFQKQSEALSEYINEKGLTPETANSDRHYLELTKNYLSAQQELSQLVDRRKLCVAQRNSIAPHIDPNMATTYCGMGDTDFMGSYNDFITQPQGHAVPGFGGDCGIIETCNIVNQQTGSNLSEADGIREYLEHQDEEWCAMGGPYERNGGTSAYGRSKFLRCKGLTFERVDGAYDTGIDLSLDEIAKRFNGGESAGIMLKAEDLSQDKLSERRTKLSGFLGADVGSYNANHATTIAGFSYYPDGSVAGVWLNDTGNWAGSNRVYVDAEKFNQMQRQTRGFAVEFSRREGAEWTRRLKM